MSGWVVAAVVAGVVLGGALGASYVFGGVPVVDDRRRMMMGWLLGGLWGRLGWWLWQPWRGWQRIVYGPPGGRERLVWAAQGWFRTRGRMGPGAG